MKNSFLSKSEIELIGFKLCGNNVLISKFANFYDPEKMIIGDNVRIDDYCIFSGKIVIGNNIHISAGVYIYGGEEGVLINDYSAISSRACIYALTDDYSGNSLVGPMVEEKYRNIINKKVVINKYCVIGTGTTILPGSIIGEGCAVGAMSLVKKELSEYGIYAGIPCKKIKNRNRKIGGFGELLQNEK